MNLQHVLNLAYHAHSNQFRKYGMLPYIFHPIEVTKTLWQWGIRDEYILAAALLHDTLEDTNISAEAIQHVAGSHVLSIVNELTFKGTSEEKGAYLAGFATASIDALLIKVADRICNTRDFLPDNYAGIYFNKAGCLWITLGHRRSEIKPDAYKAIWAGIETINISLTT